MPPEESLKLNSSVEASSARWCRFFKLERLCTAGVLWLLRLRPYRKTSRNRNKKGGIQQSENFCSTGRRCLFPPWGVFDAHKKELIFRAAA